MIPQVVGLLLGWYLVGEGIHEFDKRVVFDQARAYADKVNKPLLNFGCGQHFRYAIERSDVNTDVVPRPNVPNFVLLPPDAGGRLPWPDHYFGAAFCSHVLEHAENPQHALQELKRVSDRVFVVEPWVLFPQTWLNPTHKFLLIRKGKEDFAFIRIRR